MLTDEEAATLCKGVAQTSAELLERMQVSGGIGTSIKHGNELVTDADLAVDQLVRDVLGREHPEGRVVSEEA